MEIGNEYLDSLEKDIKQARELDKNLEDIRRRVCEPSRLGAGDKAQSTLDSLKEEANEILAAVRSLADQGKERNRSSKEMMKEMGERMKEMKRLLLESKPIDKPANGPRIFEELYEKPANNQQQNSNV